MVLILMTMVLMPFGELPEGDYGEFLQSGLTMPNVNLYQVPLCMHVVGDKGPT